jgi:hypothetical protein
MAKFQEVMKQWRRFCKSHSNCGECEFDGKDICGQAHLSDVPYSDMELRIMAWAAEHPEPVYPAWRDWLRSQYPMMGPYTMTDILEAPIPADIAQKLGIEPKEDA